VSFETDWVVLTRKLGLRIRLPRSVEAVEPIAESSRAVEGREREKRERKAKGKGKGRSREVEEEVEEKVE
jgi:hypothetical protein